MRGADSESMAARLTALLPRLAALTVIWLLATSTWTFAAPGSAPVEEPPAAVAPPAPELLIVPDVRRQAFVFAKGILEDGGFAWRVEGNVRGYAPNLVASQDPAPGTKVLDNGLPTVVLRLTDNPDYDERGLPEDSSPWEGTEIVLAADAQAAAEEPAREQPAAEAPAEEAPAESSAPADEPAEEAPAEPAKPEDEERKPDFEVPGAPPEPQDEMPLADRARLLETRMLAHPKPSRALAKYWLYQHTWIVTGAKFGWSGGDEALRILIRLDEEMQARWGFGGKSATVARAALAEVESKSK